MRERGRGRKGSSNSSKGEWGALRLPVERQGRPMVLKMRPFRFLPAIGKSFFWGRVDLGSLYGFDDNSPLVHKGVPWVVRVGRFRFGCFCKGMGCCWKALWECWLFQYPISIGRTSSSTATRSSAIEKCRPSFGRANPKRAKWERGVSMDRWIGLLGLMLLMSCAGKQISLPNEERAIPTNGKKEAIPETLSESEVGSTLESSTDLENKGTEVSEGFPAFEYKGGVKESCAKKLKYQMDSFGDCFFNSTRRKHSRWSLQGQDSWSVGLKSNASLPPAKEGYKN